MKFRYKYKKFGNFFRPVIPIQIRLDKTVINYEALIDSGADICIFHKEIGELLELDFERLKSARFQGLSSKTPADGYQAIVDIGISNNFNPAIVIFSNQISEYGYGIIGQNGFFEYYQIKFNYHSKSIYLKTK